MLTVDQSHDIACWTWVPSWTTMSDPTHARLFQQFSDRSLEDLDTDLQRLLDRCKDEAGRLSEDEALQQFRDWALAQVS